MLRNERNFIKGVHVQDSADVISDVATKKRKIKRLPGRSKSLVDTNSNNRATDTNRNMGRHTQSFLRRVPTQDDIYKILTETSDVIRPTTSTGESTRLSPYEPLPAIGTKFKPQDHSDDKVTDIPEPISTSSCDDSAQKLVREGTYNVLEPKFVKGPDVNLYQDTFDNSKERRRKDENRLEESSTTIIFGPRLPEDDGNYVEEDEMSTDLTVQTLQGECSTANDSDTLNQNRTGLSVTHVNTIPVQKLYYRDSQQNGRPRLADVTSADAYDPTNQGTNDKPQVHQSLWFD
jgi:hypothetical protein